MKLSDVLALVRRRVNDEDSRYWTDAQITDEVNFWTLDLFRQMVEAHESYGLIRYVILNTDTQRISQLKNNVFLYELPSWAWRVNQVRLVENDADLATNREGQRLDWVNTAAVGVGWNFASDRVLRVQGYDTAKTLAIWLQKLPGRVFRGTVSTTSPSDDQLKFDLAVPNGYTIDLETGAYFDALFEITSFAGSRDPRGTVLRATSVSKAYNATFWELTVTGRPQFPATPTAGDTFELHVQVQPQHLMYLILRVCESLHQKSKNIDAIAALQPQLAVERQNFIDGLQPRTSGVVHFTADPDDIPYYVDPDRDPQFPIF